jgi:undecaprenyl-diphosphatase
MPEPIIPKDASLNILRAIPKAIWTPLGISFLLLLGLGSLFAFIADGVSEHQTTGFDEAVLLGINAASSPLLDTVVSILTEFGGLIGVLTLTLGAAALFASRRRWKRAAMLLIAVGGASALNLILKGIFARSRPDLWDHIVTELTYSFPSGHAMASMSLGAGLVVALWNTRYRRIALIGSSIYVLSIAFTRLYLGVHYPTDILAGWCVSVAWVVAVKLLFSYRFRKKLPGIDT